MYEQRGGMCSVGPVLLVLLWWLVSLSPSVWAGNTHTATGDVALEQRAWWGDALSGGYVVATPGGLCLHGQSATVSATLASCRAYALNTGSPRQLEYIEDLVSRTVTYTGGAGTYWLIVHAAITATVPGWTRVLGTHYLWQLSALQPALPSRATWLLSASVSGTAITAVTDLRSVGSPVTGNFLGLSDTPDTYAGQGLQFLRVKNDETGLEFSAASGAGDSLTVAGVPVDTTGNFVNTGDITFQLTEGGPGGPDAMSAVLKPDIVGPVQLADTDFGAFTCADATGGCQLDAFTVTSAALVDGTIQGVDLAAQSVGATQLAPATVTAAHMTGDHGDVAWIAGVGVVQNVQCTNCISDGEVIDTLTCSNYLPLAGGTLSGSLMTAPAGIQYTASDTNPPCSVGVYATFADLSEGKFKKCENGVLSDLSPSGVQSTGTLTTIKENDAALSASVVTLDFSGVDFDCSLAPPTEANCAIAAAITRDTELETHRLDPTDVHGIADTALLLLQGTVTNGLLCTWNATSGRIDCVTAAGPGGATGTLTTIKENDAQIGAANIVSLDFLGADFDCSPVGTEVNCAIAAAIARQTDIETHRVDTTDVHGITNTATVLTQANIGSTVQGFDSDLSEIANNTYAAVKVPFTATGTISATNVQAAIAEVAAEAAAGGGGTLTTIKINGTNAGVGNATSLDFLGVDFDCSESPVGEINCALDIGITRDSELTAHTGLTMGVHGITNTATLLTQANIGTTVQGFDTDLSEIANNTYAAVKVPFQATGTISATNVQAAIAEVAAEAGTGTGLTANSVNPTHMANADHGGGAWSGNVLTIQGIAFGNTFPLSPQLWDQFWLLTDSEAGACDAGGGSARTFCLWNGTDWERGVVEADTLQSVVTQGSAVNTATTANPVLIGGATHAWRFYQDGAGALKQRACTADGATCTTFGKQLETASDWQLLNEAGSVCGSFDSVTMAWTGNYTGSCAPNLVVGTLVNQGLQQLDFAPGRHVGLIGCPDGQVLRNTGGTVWACAIPVALNSVQTWTAVQVFQGTKHTPVVPVTDVYTMLDADCGGIIGNTDADTLEVDLLADPTGCVVCFFGETSQTIVLDPNGSDSIIISGLTPAAGDSITLAAGIGNNLCLAGKNATTWWGLLGTGTVTDTN